ncbi:hypothetical protein ACT691_13630 [Vibrio metschnikovii]
MIEFNKSTFIGSTTAKNKHMHLVDKINPALRFISPKTLARARNQLQKNGVADIWRTLKATQENIISFVDSNVSIQPRQRLPLSKRDHSDALTTKDYRRLSSITIIPGKNKIPGIKFSDRQLDKPTPYKRRRNLQESQFQ